MSTNSHIISKSGSFNFIVMKKWEISHLHICIYFYVNKMDKS